MVAKLPEGKALTAKFKVSAPSAKEVEAQKESENLEGSEDEGSDEIDEGDEPFWSTN